MQPHGDGSVEFSLMDVGCLPSRVAVGRKYHSAVWASRVPCRRVFSVRSICVTRPSWTTSCTTPKRSDSTFSCTTRSHSGGISDLVWVMIWLIWRNLLKVDG